jgi:hypothetical protein
MMLDRRGGGHRGGKEVLDAQLDRLSVPHRTSRSRFSGSRPVWHAGLNGAFTIMTFPAHRRSCSLSPSSVISV